MAGTEVGQVLRLRSSGYDVLAELPSHAGTPVFVTGTAAHPRAIGIWLDESLPHVQVGLLDYDLRCALATRRGARR